MNWREKLKKLGHEGDGAYIGLMTFFDENPTERLSTSRMSRLGLTYVEKGETHTYNAATLERKARALCHHPFSLLESYTDRGFVYFHLPAGSSSGNVKGTVRVKYEPVFDERGRQIAVRPVPA